MKNRERNKKQFLTQAGWVDAKATFLARDAAPRHYERLTLGDGTTAILMDWPQGGDGISAFVKIAEFLLSQGLSAPEVFSEDGSQGFLLLEDFGNMSYTAALKDKRPASELYRLAVDVLIHLHKSQAKPADLPPMDWPFFQNGLQIFLDWYVPAVLEAPLSEAAKKNFLSAFQETFHKVETLPQTLVLRDYHVDNLMFLESRLGLKRCGLLDFQDARQGPCLYDLMSLLEDARIDVPGSLKESLKELYQDAFPEIDPTLFSASYTWLLLQRNTRLLGGFSRLCYHHNKKQYLTHIPRVWSYITAGLEHPDFKTLKACYAEILPLEKRVAPCPSKKLSS